MCRVYRFERREESAEEGGCAASVRLRNRLHVFLRREHDRQWHRGHVRRYSLLDEAERIHFTRGTQRLHADLAGAIELIHLVLCAMAIYMGASSPSCWERPSLLFWVRGEAREAEARC